MKKTIMAFAIAAAATLNAEICVKKGDAVAFMGDSITQQGNGSHAGYVNLVMKGLELCGVDAKKIPAGISGHKSVQMHGRLKRDVLDKKPDWMLLSCGVNDVGHGKNGTLFIKPCRILILLAHLADIRSQRRRHVSAPLTSVVGCP